jgi:hypothetical protein
LNRSNVQISVKKGFYNKPTCFRGIRGISADIGQCECGCDVFKGLGIDQDNGNGNIDLHDGESRLNVIDLEIPGRGIYWKFERTYRSGITFDGPLGHNWDFNYNRRLFIQPNGSVIRMDGYARADKYELTNGEYRSHH